MFEHDCLDICCFECLIRMCFVFLYLHQFSTVEHVSHGKALIIIIIIIIIVVVIIQIYNNSFPWPQGSGRHLTGPPLKKP